MTIGNVSPALGQNNVKAGQIEAMVNTISRGMSAAQIGFSNDFAQMMSRIGNDVSTGTSTGNVENALKQKPAASDQTYKDYYHNNRTQGTKDDTEETKVTTEDVKKLGEEMKNIVKDVLDLDEETLAEMMAELGLTATDLMVPANVVSLVAVIADTTPEGIVSDAQLSSQLSDILQNIDMLLEDFAAAQQIPVETVMDALTTAGNTEEEALPDDKAVKQPEEPSREVIVSKLVDEETGKEITVTVEHNVTTHEEVKSVAAGEHSEQDKDSNPQKESQNNIAQQVMNQLTQSLNDSEAIGEVFDLPADVNPGEVIQQIIDAVKVNITNQVQSMEIQLTPENLGKVNLTVVAKDGVITATITAQNEAVKHALESQLATLKENLNQAGVKVQDVEVTVANNPFQENMMNQNGQNDGRDHARSNARRQFRGLDEIPGEEETAEETYATLDGDSNINVTA